MKAAEPTTRMSAPASTTAAALPAVTPPSINLTARPGLDQEGGVYFATTATKLAMEVSDALSGVQAVEMSIDGASFAPFSGPFTLPAGEHTLRCRATANAGNRTEVMTGEVLSGGPTARARIVIK